MFSSLKELFYFYLFSCPPNSEMAKRPFYIMSWLCLSLCSYNTFYRNVFQILDE